MFPFAPATGFLWLAFFIYWIVAAFTAKKTVRSPRQRVRIVIRLIIAFGIFFFLRLRTPGGKPLKLINFEGHPGLEWLGLIVCIAGFALAIWARVYLGHNWGMPMSVKEKPELVTTGPYRFIRHPIYAGFLLASLGSVFTVGLIWIVPSCFFLAYFIYSSYQEDKLMASEFPQTYPVYKKRTKRLVPFIF
jgi:protein-S-isoprenylcysteine O-methyltransferase Ste14